MILSASEKDGTLDKEETEMIRGVPRFPVYYKNLDRITGVVAIKELFTVMAEGTGQTPEKVRQRPVSEFVQAPYIVSQPQDIERTGQ